MTEPDRDVLNAGEALLLRLKTLGVDYLFANGGTDFAPIIEGLAQGAAAGLAMPEALAIPHETAAVAMAHGHYLATGRPQAVMVHTNVGLANAVMGLINAATDQIPMLVMSGRTPITEAGRAGSRNVPIHWGQEMRDQAAMVREFVKWDYELRCPEQVVDVLDRALAIAMSPPRGPVYLSLPREVLCAPWSDGSSLADSPRQQPAAAVVPGDAVLAEAARILGAARRPVIIAQRGPVGGQAWGALARFAERFAIPVVEFWPSRNALGSDHPMHGGFDPGPWLEAADAVLVVDALVPWLPEREGPSADCPVIQIGPDPLFGRTPVRGFRVDLALVGEPDDVLSALDRHLDEAPEHAARRERIVGAGRRRRADAIERAQRGAGAPMSAAWVSHCLSEALDPDALVFSELGCDPSAMRLARPASYFGHALSGGLGWALPAALGAKLADRERTVVAGIGDGSYLFANPPACHQIAEALDLPILTVVFNNGAWNTVRRSTLALYPDGHAARANRMPLTSLEPAPDYLLLARASRGFAERVEDGAALPAAIERSFEATRRERRQALLDVLVAPE